MKVKVKNLDNIHDVIAWSTQTVEEKSLGGVISTHKITPVVIIQVKNTKKLMIVPVIDIEEIER